MIKVKNKHMLRKIIKEQEIPLDEVDVSLITDMSFLFKNITQIKGSISNWNTSNVENMAGMFAYSNFNQDISNWDVSNVVDMAYMFEYTKFNPDISKWNTASVRDMNGMFVYSSFNRDISNWDVSKVESMAYMFEGSEFNQDISKWNVSNVKNMCCMFKDSNFNQDISNWNVSNVRDMEFMFAYSNFNQDISNWDVSNVRNMLFMFNGIPHKYYKENCGKYARTIYLNHINPELIHIDCFVGTKEEAIKIISKKYSGEAREKYIQDILDVFEMYEKGGK